MKFALTLLLSAIAAVSANTEIRVGDTMKAGSKFGKQLLSSARRLEENGEDDAANFAWVADFSLKFQGCHSLVQWNDGADENENQDVKLSKKRLIRFRLCPSDTCSSNDAGGCEEGYGDYVIDMQTYMEAYYQSKRETEEETCGGYMENYCNCEGNGDDGWDENKCAYDCIVDAGMSECYQYAEDMLHQEDFNIEEFMECGQYEVNEDGGRRLEEGEEAEEAFYVGPYCSEQGGAINLGMFSDDTCSTPVNDDTYGASTFKSMAGFSLPYAEKSLIGSECASCTFVEQNDNEDENDNGEEQEVQLTEACTTAYANAGKCEVNIANGPTYPNDQACNYISGIKVVREDGMVFFQKAHANAVTTAFIVIFAMAFFAMGFYVWYLRTRLNVKPDALL